MGNVNPLEIGVRGTPEEVREATRSRRALFFCLASGLAISVNWLFFMRCRMLRARSL